MEESRSGGAFFGGAIDPSDARGGSIFSGASGTPFGIARLGSPYVGGTELPALVSEAISGLSSGSSSNKGSKDASDFVSESGGGGFSDEACVWGAAVYVPGRVVPSLVKEFACGLGWESWDVASDRDLVSTGAGCVCNAYSGRTAMHVY